MADSDDSVELLFFDTFSHEFNEVNYSGSIDVQVSHEIHVKTGGFVANPLNCCDFCLASQNLTSNASNDLFIACKFHSFRN